MTTYKNPWCRPTEDPLFHTYAKPLEHAGCQIYHVYKDQWDVVKAGTCITQRCGFAGAKQAAEIVEDLLSPSYEDVRGRMFDQYGHL